MAADAMSGLARALIADLAPDDLGDLLHGLVENAPDVVVAALADRLRPLMQPHEAGEWMGTGAAAKYRRCVT